MRGDFDHDEPEDGYAEWFDDSDDDYPPLCSCGRMSCAEACEQCGAPLCPMCFETGAGFCSKHPDDNYQPHEPDETEA